MSQAVTSVPKTVGGPKNFSSGVPIRFAGKRKKGRSEQKRAVDRPASEPPPGFPGSLPVVYVGRPVYRAQGIVQIATKSLPRKPKVAKKLISDRHKAYLARTFVERG